MVIDIEFCRHQAHGGTGEKVRRTTMALWFGLILIAVALLGLANGRLMRILDCVSAGGTFPLCQSVVK